MRNIWETLTVQKIKKHINSAAEFVKIYTGAIFMMGCAILMCVKCWNFIKLALQFCDRRPASISVIVTTMIAVATGLFTIYQARTLKRKGKIRVYSLYNSIAESLQKNTENIKHTVENYSENDKQYIALMTKEWRIRQEILNRVYNLEKLLYEHGKRGDSKYTQETIKVISAICELAHIINISYAILEKEDNLIVQDGFSYIKLQQKFDYLIEVIKKYKSDILNEYIPL